MIINYDNLAGSLSVLVILQLLYWIAIKYTTKVNKEYHRINAKSFNATGSIVLQSNSRMGLYIFYIFDDKRKLKYKQIKLSLLFLIYSNLLALMGIYYNFGEDEFLPKLVYIPLIGLFFSYIYSALAWWMEKKIINQKGDIRMKIYLISLLILSNSITLIAAYILAPQQEIIQNVLFSLAAFVIQLTLETIFTIFVILLPLTNLSKILYFRLMIFQN